MSDLCVCKCRMFFRNIQWVAVYYTIVICQGSSWWVILGVNQNFWKIIWWHRCCRKDVVNFIMFHIKSYICFAFALCDGFPNVLLETLKSLQVDTLLWIENKACPEDMKISTIKSSCTSPLAHSNLSLWLKKLYLWVSSSEKNMPECYTSQI